MREDKEWKREESYEGGEDNYDFVRITTMTLWICRLINENNSLRTRTKT